MPWSDRMTCEGRRWCGCRTACCRCCRCRQVMGISIVVAVLAAELHVLVVFALVAERCFALEVGEVYNGRFATRDFVEGVVLCDMYLGSEKHEELWAWYSPGLLVQRVSFKERM